MCKKTATAPIGPLEVAVLGAENTSSRFDVKEWGEGRLAAGIVSLMIMKKHSFQVQTRYKIGRMCLPNNPDQPTKPGRWICSFSDPSKRSKRNNLGDRMCADLDGWTLRTHRYLKVLQLKMGPVSQLVLPQNNLIRNHSKPILHTETMKDIGIIIMSYPKLWIVSPASCSLVSFPFLGCNDPRVVHEIPHFSWLNPQTNVQKWYKFWKATSPSGGKIHGFERFHPVPPQKPQHLEDEWESHYGSLHFIQVLVHQTELLPTSSTAQGGGGSFKNRKPIGELGCCEWGMAERSHWWTERCLRSPLFLSLSLTIYLPTSLSSMYLSIDLSISLFLSFI